MGRRGPRQATYKKRADFVDLTGRTFGRLGVITLAPRTKHQPTRWYCVCICGNETISGSYALTSGKVKSCGCLIREVTGKRARTHGLTKTKAYRVWVDMRRRCFETNDISYKNYGGRGITVCDRWKDPHGGFENFLADMGHPPQGKTLDRIDNGKSYSPENCRWASWQEQHRNTRRTRIEYLNGVGKPFSEWIEAYGANYYRVLHRLRNGWPFEDALLRPKGYQRHLA